MMGWLTPKRRDAIAKWSRASIFYIAWIVVMFLISP